MTNQRSGDTWRKSSFSAETGDCVEVPGTLSMVRDSKNPGGPALTTPDLPSVISAIKTGRFTPIA